MSALSNISPSKTEEVEPLAQKYAKVMGNSEVSSGSDATAHLRLYNFLHFGYDQRRQLIKKEKC